MTRRAQLYFALASLALIARAHDTWLQPERFTATPGALLELGLTSGAGFNGPENAIKPERIAIVRGRLASEVVVLPAPAESDRTLKFSATLPRPGVAVFAVELKPRVLELPADKIETYFREIHAGDALRVLWAGVPEPRKWRESYVKNAKTFVRVGEPAAGERAWAEPLGLRLEIIPERDPTALREGDELPVRVLRGGAPLAGFTVAFVSAGETREHVVVTDDAGRARAKLDARGAWLVHGTDLRRSTAAELEWESDFTTMVVEAR
jgi:uncharacterized GH25 family protein